MKMSSILLSIVKKAAAQGVLGIPGVTCLSRVACLTPMPGLPTPIDHLQSTNLSGSLTFPSVDSPEFMLEITAKYSHYISFVSVFLLLSKYHFLSLLSIPIATHQSR
jgi:hypothetical protein